MQVVLSGFGVILLCFVQEKKLNVGMYFLGALLLVDRCDGDVISVRHDLNLLWVVISLQCTC